MYNKLLALLNDEHEINIPLLKIILLIITRGSLTLNNQELGNELGTSERNARRYIATLKDNDLITIITSENTRTIKPSIKLLEYFQSEVPGKQILTSQSSQTHSLQVEVQDKPKQSVRGEMLSRHDMDVKEVIEYLNLKTGKKFNHKARASYKDIRARLNEGYTVDQMKHAVDVKTEQWKGNSKYEKYLRPETLFGNKLENYINEKKGGIDWHNIDLETDNPLLNYKHWKEEQLKNNPPVADYDSSELPF